MKLLYKKYRLRLQALSMLVTMFIATIVAISCEKEELEVQQGYSFNVKIMPVPKEITFGQTVEIRMSIQSSGHFQDERYYLRYFQFDGKGSLRYYDQSPYLPNDIYELPKREFRLYYTSASNVSQSFDIWISDGFGSEKQVSFNFNSTD